MKIYDQRVSRGLNVSTAALIAVVFYLIIDVILSFTQSLIDPSGGNYNTIFGITEFLIATIYWGLINFIFFSRSGGTGRNSIFSYIIITMLPILVFTIATSLILYIWPTTDFTLSWNLMTWIIAPTLFWYLPFSYVFYAFGYYITIPVFMLIILIYMISIQAVGVILGLARKASVAEKEALERKQQERQQFSKRSVDVSFETPPGSITQLNNTELISTVRQSGLKQGANPFRRNENESVIINTDSLDLITDEMLEEYNAEPLIDAEFREMEDIQFTGDITESTVLGDDILGDLNLNNFSIDDLVPPEEQVEVKEEKAPVTVILTEQTDEQENKE